VTDEIGLLRPVPINALGLVDWESVVFPVVPLHTTEFPVVVHCAKTLPGERTLRQVAKSRDVLNGALATLLEADDFPQGCQCIISLMVSGTDNLRKHFMFTITFNVTIAEF
jgi:hypothetical protein